MEQYFKTYLFISFISQSGFDGIVGLAYPSMAAYNFKPLFDNIMN